MSGRHHKAKLNLLDILSKEENKTILAELNERSYRKRHLLFMPYHKEDLVFIVKEGKLRVYLGLDGKELSVAILGPGDVYSTHTRAYVEALEDTTILTCHAFKFFKLAGEQQSLNLALISSMGAMMSGTIATIENLYFNCTDKRVAAFFYEQALLNGEPNAAGTYLDIGLTVDNIAKIVGSSRQTVSTLISNLEKDGVLKKVARGEYLIKDMAELQVIANSCPE
ncbi:Crp/Fnr family transcriptional regulator [Fundidesulfovibrio terrae]|uniref:Crp/Fnr family transcriptional regulator n=1 Tax=Fundidesulfovibrio terrae TaxID=2922866 RepID=UPI002435E1DB|nr:Crp/Fnr family transcriptional regulator [Fundidesulfovibrio terrae]